MSQFPPPSPETILVLKAKYSQYSNIFATNPKNAISNFDGYNVEQIRTAYKYNGIQNQNFKIKPLIAIVIPYAYSKLQENFDLFCESNNLPPYTLNIININARYNISWSVEECIDTQWSYAMCPEANILVVEAESTSVQNLAVAIDVAKSYGPAVINMSWGFHEFNFEQDEPLASLFSYRGDFINHVFVANGIRLNNNLKLLNSYDKIITLGVQNILYSNYSSNGKELFYDVTKGTAGSNYYPATKGWDIPTGLGTPYGEAVVTFLANQPNPSKNNLLANKIGQDSLNSVTNALPQDVSKDIIFNVVELVYVWVIENKSLQKFICFLQTSGFKNILVNDVPINNQDFEDLPTYTVTAQTRGVTEDSSCNDNCDGQN